jgi:hypothetical protein
MDGMCDNFFPKVSLKVRTSPAFERSVSTHTTHTKAHTVST